MRWKPHGSLEGSREVPYRQTTLHSQLRQRHCAIKICMQQVEGTPLLPRRKPTFRVRLWQSNATIASRDMCTECERQMVSKKTAYLVRLLNR